ncbi:MAG: hypothetical protein H6Q13_3471 [Bacteroidetes bacterium]|nr:hypothetical protein [Bacteroidota bacterium]
MSKNRPEKRCISMQYFSDKGLDDEDLSETVTFEDLSEREDLDFSDFALIKLFGKKFGRKFVSNYPEYPLMVGERHLAAALVLAQIIYWSQLEWDSGGYEGRDYVFKSKLQVKKDGEYCLVKSAREMHLEIGIPERTVEKCYAHLKKLGFIRTENHNFNRIKTTHIFVNESKFCQEFFKAAVILDKKRKDENYDDFIEEDDFFRDKPAPRFINGNDRGNWERSHSK